MSAIFRLWYEQLTEDTCLTQGSHYQGTSKLVKCMQFTMGTRANQDIEAADPEIINNYLGSSFKHMADYGESIYRPFMQASHFDPSLFE